jgi:hypothetical protein
MVGNCEKNQKKVCFQIFSVFMFNTPPAVVLKYTLGCATLRRANSPENVLEKSAPGILTGTIFDPTQAISKNLSFVFRYFFQKVFYIDVSPILQQGAWAFIQGLILIHLCTKCTLNVKNLQNSKFKFTRTDPPLQIGPFCRTMNIQAQTSNPLPQCCTYRI